MAPIRKRLEAARRELLDLTTRSRLLHTPRGARVKIVEVVDELSEQVFRILVSEGKAMSFLPRPEPDPTEHGEADADDASWVELLEAAEPDANGGIAQRHVDTRLQTSLRAVKLEKRLLQIYYDARNFEEEQGVNVLYLALGFLKWFESKASDKPRLAPLILLPVTIDRRSAGARFNIRFADDEISTNLSLQEKLKVDFGITLPDVPQMEDLSPEAYYIAVARAIAGRPGWEVLHDDIVLGFFSFAKFLMYRDLDPENWPERCKIDLHPLVQGLLGDGFRDEPSPFGEDADIDEILDPKDMVHVVDADGSQTLAIEEVRQGRNLVIQGPPGTGKSQTISNLIAAAVLEGKKVLFVAEKMAALEVVKRRLDQIGLGVMCLELHSHKARKKEVLDELERTLDLGRPRLDGMEDVVSRLRARRDQLNQYIRDIHTPLEAGQFTPYQIAGQLVALSAAGIKPQDFDLEGARGWNRVTLQQKEERLHRLSDHILNIGVPAQHPWRGVRLKAVLPADVIRLDGRVAALKNRLSAWHGAVQQLAAELGITCTTWNEVDRGLRLAHAVARAPALDPTALTNAVWEEKRTEITAVCASGRILAASRQALRNVFVPEAWEHDLRPIRRTLKAHGESLFRIFRSEYRNARSTLRGFLETDLPKSLDRQLSILDSLAKGQQALGRVREMDVVGCDAFGSFWRGEASDWAALSAIEEWEGQATSEDLPANPRLVRARVNDPAAMGLAADQIKEAIPEVAGPVESLCQDLSLDVPEAFARNQPLDVPLSDVIERLTIWSAESHRLQEWITYYAWATDARAVGLSEVVDRLHDGRIPADRGVDCFRYAFFEALIREVFERCPALAIFSGCCVGAIPKLSGFSRLPAPSRSS